MLINRRVRVKFCGITRVEDALAAAALGVDAVGLILSPRSLRCLELQPALAIRSALPPLLAAVALFLDDDADFVRSAMDLLRPDLLQFHGTESAAYCEAFGARYLKAVPMGDNADPATIIAAHPRATGFVLDGHRAGESGGSGRRFDWTRVPHSRERPLVLAGGLTPENVGAAIRAARPYGVDVSSGIEGAPRRKDADKMRRFIDEVERVCGEIEK